MRIDEKKSVMPKDRRPGRKIRYYRQTIVFDLPCYHVKKGYFTWLRSVHDNISCFHPRRMISIAMLVFSKVNFYFLLFPLF